MKQSIRRTAGFLFVKVLFTTHVVCSIPQLICPDISYLNESASLTCFTNSPFRFLQYEIPDVAIDLSPRCQANPPTCVHAPAYNASIINSTHTELKILSVQPAYAGTWNCADGLERSSCTLVVTKIPTCNITSNHRTDDIALHEQLSLAVDIQGYHCSAAYNFSLQTGTVAELLSNVVRGATTSLDVTESHLGAVRLIFSCHTQQWNLTCGGVTKLIKSNDTSSNVDIGTEQTTIIVAVSSTLVLIMVVVVVVVVFLIYRKQVNTTDPDSQNQPSDPRPVDEEETDSGLYATVMGRSPGPMRKNVIKVVVSQVPCDTAPKANTIHRGTTSQGKHMQRDMAPQANTIPRGMASQEKDMSRDMAPQANTIPRGMASQEKDMSRDMAPQANTIPCDMAP